MRAGLRRLAGALLAGAALSGAAAAGATGPNTVTPVDEVRRPVADPHYGDGLFHFFQEEYFSAITTLMVSQHFERVSHHADEAEILRGGMLLSYGLHREAGEIFAQLIERGAAASVRDRAWFYLAKVRYQRGLHEAADEALARIGDRLPPALDEERRLLQANVMMAREDFAGAARVLEGLATKEGAGVVARYNLGVALIRNGDIARGSELLDVLGRQRADDEEQRSLRDKANVALGFAALQDGQAEVARGKLARVRLSGPHSNKALLGFGWAAVALDDPKLALVPWTELAGRDANDSAVLEARIAVPHAYAELGAYGQSLAHYERAIGDFEREKTALDESVAAIRSGQLVDALLALNPGDQMGWFWNLNELPQLPHTAHLAPVLASHEFQEAFKNYRDLRFLERKLRDWQDRLGVFDDMLAHRRQAFAQRLPRVREPSRDTGLDALRQRRDALAAELGRAEQLADGAAFADDGQRGLLARIAASQATLKALGADPEFDAARERLRLASGALTWQLAQQHPIRIWEAQKALATTDSALAEARRRDASLARAQRDEPARFDAFGARIPALGQRLGSLLPRVVALGREQQELVQGIAVAQLQRQQDSLAVYATQARFAVAQLYDRAIHTRESRDAQNQREAGRANQP